MKSRRLQTSKKVYRILRNFLVRCSYCSSQLGQDVWVYGEVFAQKKNGFFVDIGAYDGLRLSNTYMLERRYGWKGICIEANPATFQQLKKNRKTLCLNVCLDSSEGLVTFVDNGALSGIYNLSPNGKDCKESLGAHINMKTTTLGKVLKEHSAPIEMEYLSVDTEGSEERILQNFEFDQYQFKCITEYFSEFDLKPVA